MEGGGTRGCAKGWAGLTAHRRRPGAGTPLRTPLLPSLRSVQPPQTPVAPFHPTPSPASSCHSLPCLPLVEQDFFNHLDVVPSQRLVVLADTPRKAIYTLHYSGGALWDTGGGRLGWETEGGMLLGPRVCR